MLTYLSTFIEKKANLPKVHYAFYRMELNTVKLKLNVKAETI